VTIGASLLSILLVFDLPPAPLSTIVDLIAIGAVEIAQHKVFQYAVGALRKIEREISTIGALNANHIALVIELHVEPFPVEGVRMQHNLHGKRYIG